VIGPSLALSSLSLFRILGEIVFVNPTGQNRFARIPISLTPGEGEALMISERARVAAVDGLPSALDRDLNGWLDGRNFLLGAIPPMTARNRR
jgi:hypothetical protein